MGSTINRWAYKLVLLYSLKFFLNTQRLQFFVFFIRCKVYLSSTSPTGLSRGDMHVTTKTCWQLMKKQRHDFANKGLSSQRYGFSSGYVWMWELDYKESWVPKNWCFWTVVSEKTLECPLDCKEIQPVHPKGDQSWVFIGRLMLKLKLHYFGHLMWRSDSLEKTQMLGKIEGRRRRGQQRMRWLDGITDSMDMSWVDSGSWWWTGRPGVLWSMGSQRVSCDWVTELNWLSTYQLLYQWYLLVLKTIFLGLLPHFRNAKSITQ